MDITRDDITILHKLLAAAKADSTPEDFSRGMEILDNLYAVIARGELGIQPDSIRTSEKGITITYKDWDW